MYVPRMYHCHSNKVAVIIGFLWCANECHLLRECYIKLLKHLSTLPKLLLPRTLTYNRGCSLVLLSCIPGDHCEIEQRTMKYSVCPPGVCKGAHTRCTPLIRGGFRCELCTDGDLSGDTCRDCASLDHHTPLCELMTRSFPRGSFLMYPSLRRRHRFNIRLK